MFRRRSFRRKARGNWMPVQYEVAGGGTSGGLLPTPPNVQWSPILRQSGFPDNFKNAGLDDFDTMRNFVVERIVGRFFWSLELANGAGQPADFVYAHMGIAVVPTDEDGTLDVSATVRRWDPVASDNMDARWMWHDVQVMQVPAATNYSANSHSVCGPAYGLIDLRVKRRLRKQEQLVFAIGTATSLKGRLAPDYTFAGHTSMHFRAFGKWRPFSRQYP